MPKELYDFFYAHCTFHIHSSILLCLISHYFCSHAQVFQKTLLYEFHISYSHYEMYLFSLNEIVLTYGVDSSVKN